jgi:hypothetical protein
MGFIVVTVKKHNKTDSNNRPQQLTAVPPSLFNTSTAVEEENRGGEGQCNESIEAYAIRCSYIRLC